MLGFGFLNSVFLLALGAMVLPIVIHILNRRRQRKIPFASIEFLFEMSKRRMRKVNIRRWLILLLRTLAVILIVLAFARPTIRSNAALFMSGEAPKNVIICLDRSASMGVDRRVGTAFSAAQELAREVVDESGKNDRFNVIAFSTRADVLFDTGTGNREIVKSAIDELTVTHEATSPALAVATALELLESSEIGGGEIYVISDFRETADSLVPADTPDEADVLLLPVYREAIDNVSIDRVFTPRKLIRPGEVVKVGVAVTNHSRSAPVDFQLELFVDQMRKAEKVVTLGPASSATVDFAVSLNHWGIHRCRVAKNHDRLSVDDDRFFLIEVSRKIPVTLVRGRKFDSNGKPAAYFYVEKALNPRGSGEGEFGVITLDEKDLTASKLPSHGVVVWTEPGSLDTPRLELFKRYIRAGGSALVFLGSGHGGMWANPDFLRYLGARKAAPKERRDGERFASFQQAHPVFNLFSEEELELLSMSRIRKYVSVGGVAPDSVLSYLGGGDPGVWECRRGKGRLLIVAAAPDMPSGDLPLSPMFLPFIHTSVSYLASTEGAEFHRENLAGKDLPFDLPPRVAAQGTPLRVVEPSGEERTPLVYEASDGQFHAMLPRPRNAGFYTLFADTSRVAHAAVNLDAQESNLNPMTFGESMLSGARLVETSEEFIQNLREERQGREIYTFFLLMAVGALVAEALLGRKA